MSIKAAIFDVDGTLVDSVDIHAEVWQRAFADFGKKTDFAKVRSQIGKGSDTLMPEFLTPEELKAEGKKLSEHRSKLFKTEYMDRVKPFPKVAELFRRMRDAGLKIVLASSGKPEEVQHYEKLCGLEDLVDAETSSADAEKSKPHGDIFSAALERLGNMAPADALVVGDTPWDAEAAAKAGLKTVGLRCGGFAEQDLRKAGVIAVYQDPAELLEKFDNSPFVSS